MDRDMFPENRFAIFLRGTISVLLLGLGQVPLRAQVPAGTAGAVPAAPQVRLYRISPDTDLEVSKPDFRGQLKGSPHDYGTFLKNGFSRKNLPWLAAVAGSTALLIVYDQKIYNNTVRAGKKLNIARQDKTKAFIKLGKLPIFRGPTDLGSAMYFIGDGWVTVGLISSFEIYGSLKDDWRAVRTAHDLLEGMLLAGVTTQALKRVTGRETPSAATKPRGVWRFFPNEGAYFAHQTRYDAFPSGHVANALMAVTVMADNYPEKKYIKPVGYSLIGVLGFQMVNNGVHWASDYPLAIAIGYPVGKLVAAHGKRKVKRDGSPQQDARSALKFHPVVLRDATLAPGLAYVF